MAKYKALADILPIVKAGDIVELQEEPIPEYRSLLQPVGEGEEVTDNVDEDDPLTLVTQPSRDDLKKRASELNINFAPNIPTERLIELIGEAEAKKAAEEGGEE